MITAVMMETSPVGILMFDREGRITFANPRVQELAGLLGIPDVVGCAYNDPLWRLLDEHGDPLPDDRLAFAQVLSTGQPVSELLYAIDLPGDQRAYLSSSAAPLRDSSGGFDGVIVTAQDITSRIQAEARQNWHERKIHGKRECQQVSARPKQVAPADAPDFVAKWATCARCGADCVPIGSICARCTVRPYGGAK